jgi:hypothetical protein
MLMCSKPRLMRSMLGSRSTERSASPTGCAFAHIPTGTTANHRIDVDEEKDRSDAMIVAPRAIGAGTEIGRATP